MVSIRDARITLQRGVEMVALKNRQRPNDRSTPPGFASVLSEVRRAVVTTNERSFIPSKHSARWRRSASVRRSKKAPVPENSLILGRAISHDLRSRAITTAKNKKKHKKNKPELESQTGAIFVAPPVPSAPPSNCRCKSAVWRPNLRQRRGWTVKVYPERVPDGEQMGEFSNWAVWGIAY